MNPELVLSLRAKKLGILIRDARLTAGKTMKDCGEAVGISGSTISAYEMGSSSPSLPELEILCHHLKVPIDRFWKDKIIAQDTILRSDLAIDNYAAIRQVQIGQVLSKARIRLEMTYEEITEETGITYGRMKRFEAGESPIPLPELELLSNCLEIPMKWFAEADTEIGKWISAQSLISDFLALPLDVQRFVTNPVNKHYLDVARNLSNLSAEELRAIAESLLEITI